MNAPRPAKSRVALAVLVSLPGLGLAVAGYSHQKALNAATARDWWTFHVPLLVVFPLLAVALAVPLWGDRRAIAWGARLAGYVFAVGYTALDAIDGIAAGLVIETAPDAPGTVVPRLFEIGDRLGRAGIWAFAVAMILTALALWPRHGAWTMPGVVMFLIGCRLFHQHHIFAPQGTNGMLLLAAGTAWLILAPRRKSVRS